MLIFIHGMVVLHPPFGFPSPVSIYRITFRSEEGSPQQPHDSRLLTQGSSALLRAPHVQVHSALVTWPWGNQAAALKSRPCPGCCFGCNAVCVSRVRGPQPGRAHITLAGGPLSLQEEAHTEPSQFGMGQE